ncbi:MAG: hypothetical protein K2X54_31210 [Methylobacterium organophilum]|nr:hypothetical protein [Methylobacterium organophilum]
MERWQLWIREEGLGVAGTAVAVYLRPHPDVVSAIQDFASVVLAAAGEIPPDPTQSGSVWATQVGGLGVAAMLGVRSLERRASGHVGLMAVASIDILLDGRVLGIAFAATIAEGRARGCEGQDANITNAMEDLPP